MTNELKTSKEWYGAQDVIVILDPDGWRHKDLTPVYFDTVPITEDEFNNRLSQCTIMMRNKL